MKLKKICLTILWLIPFTVYSQYKELEIGDVVPEMVFDMLNSQNVNNQLSSYKGKLLIIDCWNIYCAPCIQALPEFAKLQDKLKGKLNILALEGGSSQEKVMAFLKNREAAGKRIALPVTYAGDSKKSMFYTLFPILNYGFPVEIWINEKGNLIGITSSAFVREEVINEVLKGNVNALMRKHYQKDFKKKEPLLVNKNGGSDTSFIYRSLITPFIDSIPNGNDLVVQRTSKMTRIFAANRTISELVKTAIYRSPSDDLYNKLLELKVKDPSAYIRPEIKENFFKIMKKQGYCYELILPPERSEQEAFEIMLDDIQRFFSINVSLEYKELKCLTLEKGSQNALKSNGEAMQYNSTEENGISTLDLKNKDFKIVMSFLNKRTYPIVLDKTSIDYPVDLHLEITDRYDYEKLKTSLKKLGLIISEKITTQKFVVISEKNKSTLNMQ